MTAPATHDDSWNDLYAELGLDKPAAAPALPPEPMVELPPEEEGTEAWVDEPSAADAEVEASAGEGTDEEDGEEDDAEGADGAGQAEEGPPGTGRKRRRRRRRRKKGAPGTVEGAVAGQTAPAEETVEDDEATAPVPLAGDEAAFDEEGSEETDLAEPATVAVAVHEDTQGDPLRELIATWNVPSWDDIIGGLYRPHR